MGRKKLWLIAFVLLFAASGILSACSSKGSSSNEKVDLDKKVKLTWMAILYHQQPPKDSVLKEIEKLTNTELDI
ncbi:peptide ABC transporter substrate-binding protein, partial [Bacillus sp. JR_15]